MSALNEAVVFKELSAPFAALMTELLHDMGQPLTTLQGCRLLPLLNDADRNDLACEMAEQVEKVTELYRELRRLVAAVTPATCSSHPLTLAEALRNSTAEWQREAHRRNIALVIEPTVESNAAQEINSRTEQAVRAVMDAALADAPVGCVLRVSASTLSATISVHDTAALLIEVDKPTPLSLTNAPATAGWRLRVAAALLQSDGGRVVYNLQPFRAMIDLPGAKSCLSR